MTRHGLIRFPRAIRFVARGTYIHFYGHDKVNQVGAVPHVEVIWIKKIEGNV